MAAELSTPTARMIRVYCPSHKIGFQIAAKSTIECTSQTHTLARDFPSDSFWEYCCDCQHYWPIDDGKGNSASEECPVCERKIARRFLCAVCKVFSIESDDAGRRKAYSITAQGLVSPACPGCLHRSSNSRLEHRCDDLACVFLTTREVCPFCDERLEPPPAFPCSVADYVAKLPRTAVVVKFDAELGLIKETASGDCYLIPADRQTSLGFVIPKAATLASKQDYYNAYYELFNCENPAAGEVVIISPTIAEPVEGGWQLRAAGSIEIKPDAAATSDQICPACGTASSAQHTFCKRCGTRLGPTSVDEEVSSEPTPSDESYAASSYIPDPQPSYQPAPIPGSSSGLQTKTILGVVGGIALLGIVLTIIVTVSSNKTASLEKKLDDAIARGQLLTPNADSAQSLYFQLKNTGASEDTLRRYREKLLPLLTEQPYRMINQLMVPGNDDPPLADWQSAHQATQWAVELRPGDSPLQARSAYCEGRIAFLLKDEASAIQSWTRAAETDKAWPLPLNGIGLIYSGRKNYSTARTYYFDAVRRDPNWAYPYNNLGTSYFMERNYSEAKGYYQKATQLAPQWARPHAWLGDIAMNEGDYATAVQEFSLVLDAGATGTKNMELNKIRQKLDLAQSRAAYQY